MTVLVDQYGNPLRREVMTKSQTEPKMGGVRSVRHTFDTAGITPERMAQVFREANNGFAAAMFDLAEQLEEKDPHYMSVLNTRKRAVIGLDFIVEAADASPEAEKDAEFVRELVGSAVFKGALYDILDAIGKGVSYSEIIWNLSEKQWNIEKISFCPQKWFEFDRVDGVTPRLIGDANERIDLEPYKYITHIHKSKTGIPVRSGLVRSCAWMWLFKNFSFKDWMVFTDAYGQPIRIGKYDAGASAEDREVLLQAVTNIGNDLGAIIPASMSIEFVRDNGATSSADLYERLIRIADEQMSKAVLGQTSTTDAMKGGGLAGNESHNEVRGDICTSDAEQLSATLNAALIEPYVYLNKGARKKYPRLVIGRAERVNAEKEIQTVRGLVDMGAKISAKKIMDRFNMPAAETDDDALTPVQAAMPGLMAYQAPIQKALAAKDASDDAISALAGEAADDWEEILSPLLAAIDQAVEEAKTPDDLRQRLLDLSATMPVDPIAQKLAMAAFSARFAGNVGAKLK